MMEAATQEVSGNGHHAPGRGLPMTDDMAHAVQLLREAAVRDLSYGGGAALLRVADWIEDSDPADLGLLQSEHRYMRRIIAAFGREAGQMKADPDTPLGQLALRIMDSADTALSVVTWGTE
jgi:hypothetical protein